MNLLYQRATELLDAAKAGLAGRVPERAFVTIGPAAWDTSVEDCVEQLTVSLLGLRMRQRDAESAAQLSPVFSIALLRCVTALEDEGQIPSAELLGDEAAALYQDAGDLVNEVTARWNDKRLFPDIVGATVDFMDLIPQGPAGGLAGWRWDIGLTPLA